MTSINPLKFSITNQYFKPVNEEEQAKKQAENQNAGQKQKKQYESKEILNFLAAQNADLVPTKKAGVSKAESIDVAKYVSPEQEARIAGFMQGFEADFDEAFAAAANEFEGISDKAASNIALAYINSSYSK